MQTLTVISSKQAKLSRNQGTHDLQSFSKSNQISLSSESIWTFARPDYIAVNENMIRQVF